MSSPFSQARLTLSSQFPTEIISKYGSVLRVSVCLPDDQLKIKEFVESIHSSLYSFDEVVLSQEKNEFPNIYPEYYDKGKWNDTVQFKCVHNDDIIGTIGVVEESAEIIYISSFYVGEQYRRSGIGRLLWNICFDFIRSIISIASSQGRSYRVHLITAKDLMTNAYNFYKMEGFNEIPIEFSSPYCSLVKLEKVIDI